MPQKKVTSRAEAGLVEEDFTPQPNDEALADGSWLDEENQDPEELVETAPSSRKIAGMSEEEQDMDMTPVVVGPPGYGSPVPLTSAGRLLPLNEHPFNPEALPEDHPVMIDPDYGKGYSAVIPAADVGTSFPGAPGRTDLENDMAGTPTEEQAASYEEMTKADLQAEAESRGLDVPSGATKAEIVSVLEEDDAA